MVVWPHQNNNMSPVATFIADRWKLPRKPRALVVGIALAVFNVLATLAYASVATQGAPAQYVALAAQMIAALLLRGVAQGTPGMRWVYIAYDALQLGAAFRTHDGADDGDIFLAAVSLAVWTCLTLPASHDWFRRVPRHQLGLCRHGVLRIPEDMRQRAANGAWLGLVCALFFLYHASHLDTYGWLWPATLAPLAACVVLEAWWARKLSLGGRG